MKPTPEELFIARDVIDRAMYAFYEEEYRWPKPDGGKADPYDLFGSLAEAKRSVARITSWWGSKDPAYQEAWERMVGEQE